MTSAIAGPGETEMRTTASTKAGSDEARSTAGDGRPPDPLCRSDIRVVVAVLSGFFALISSFLLGITDSMPDDGGAPIARPTSHRRSSRPEEPSSAERGHG